MNKKETGIRKTDKQVVRWLSDVMGHRKWQILGILMLQAILGIASVAYAMLLRNMIDAAIGKDEKGFLAGAALLVSLIMFQIGCRALDRYLEEDARSTLENRLKERLLSVLLKRDYASVTGVHSGEWMNRMTSDTVVTADGLVQILPGTVGMLIRMAAALLMILVLEPGFGYILIPGGLLLVVLTYGFRRYMKKLHKKIQEKDGKLKVFLQEHLGSLLIVRAFAKEELVLEGAKEKMRAHKQARMKRNHFSNICNIGFSGMMQGIYVFGVVYCAYGIMMESISYGTLTAVLQLISQVQTPMANITGYLPKYYAMLASAERLMEAECFQCESQKETKSLEEVCAYYEAEFCGLGLKDASFTYMPPVQDTEIMQRVEKEGMPVVLHAVNLEVQKGDYVAFTGHSGCGKSTVMKILMCLYPLDEGERYLQGEKRAALNRTWQRLFAYVPQGNHLMSGSIREMIAFSDKQMMQDEKRMRSALKISCAEEFVDALEEGLDTVLGERGHGLSEGQMQRLAIARAIFSGNPIIILDEATSALDDETEKRVLENLKKMTDKTVLIVTHRPAALEICNKIVRITEAGFQMEYSKETGEKNEGMFC